MKCLFTKPASVVIHASDENQHISPIIFPIAEEDRRAFSHSEFAVKVCVISPCGVNTGTHTHTHTSQGAKHQGSGTLFATWSPLVHQ